MHWKAPPCHSSTSYLILLNINILGHNIQILANMAGTYDVAGARAAAGGADLRSLPLCERRKRLQAILPAKSPIVSEALSVTGRGCELFELMGSNHLEGITAKRLTDPYEPRVQRLKVKNPSYSQADGRGDLFNGPRRRSAAAARAIGGVAVTAPYTGRQ